jgi:hypothetical protein
VKAATLWAEWGRLTRFTESTRLAFARERDLWTGLEIKGKDDVKLEAETDQGRYEVPLGAHLDALGDEQTLYASVLIHSYALAEAAALERLRCKQPCGIEDWGTRLLERSGHGWSDVLDGMPGAVEVAVLRNAFAHGNRGIRPHAGDRLQAAGSATLKVGNKVTLGYEGLRCYRSRLRSLLQCGGFQTPQKARTLQNQSSGG